MTDSTSLPARKDVPVEQTWALETIFATPAAWENACKQLEDLLPDLISFQGQLKGGPQVLLACIRQIEECSTRIGQIVSYASCASSVDTLDQDATARQGQAESLQASTAAALAFFDPELMSLGFDLLKSWVDATPKLAFFAQYLDRLQKRSAHVRSGEVEEVLALTGDPFAGAFGVFNMLTNADIKFKPATAADGVQHEIGQSSIGTLLASPDRELRRSAWQNYADGSLAFKNTAAAALTTAIKQDVFLARARRYPSALHASLEPNNVPVEVFHNLIDVFKENLPIWHKYWRVRRKALKLDSFGVYDIKAPLGASQPVVPFEQAVDWICEGMAPLGDDYVKTMRRGCLDLRWVDRACNRGKQEGAFSSGWHGTQPFIMVSYSDDIFSLSTLAHELGHSMHSYYSWANQRPLYSEYGLFVAEVASNFNQATVRDYLMRTQPAPDFQIALIEEAMSNYHRYFFIMPTLARFELEMHTRAEKGAPLNADILIGILADLFKEGYGDEVEFDRDRIGITWAQFLHMYMNFYVYQYATGISGAHALSHAVTTGVPGAAEGYLNFLKSGSSRYPLDILKTAGVDLTSPAPVSTAFQSLSSLVDRLDKLVG